MLGENAASQKRKHKERISVERSTDENNQRRDIIRAERTAAYIRKRLPKPGLADIE